MCEAAMAQNSCQDYLYMLQVCIAAVGLVAVFIVFMYETLDKYTDSRKEILRGLVRDAIASEKKLSPEVWYWIQNIGKGDRGEQDTDDLLKRYLEGLGIKVGDIFIENIKCYRRRRHRLTECGLAVVMLWAGMSMLYLVAQTFSLYDGYTYTIFMFLIMAPLVITVSFLSWVLKWGYKKR